MITANLLSGVAGFVEALATLAIIAMAFGLMLGILKPADAFKRIGLILGSVIALLIVPQIAACTWSAIPLWQQLALIVIGSVILLAFTARRGKRSRLRE